MQVTVKALDGSEQGAIELSDAVFGISEVRKDLIQRMVRYQLAKRRAGTHAVKNRAEIRATGKKYMRQKGSGGARHGSKKVAQFRGGGRAFGPVSRDHAHDLPKKIRTLALKHALSSKAGSEGGLIVLNEVSLDSAKTKALRTQFENLGLANALIIGGAELNDNFALAARNIPNIDVLPVQGINVYDILRRNTLVLTKDAVEALEARLG